MDYGQAAANSEWDAVQSIAGHFGISVHRLELGFPLEVQRGEYFVRNALLILIAAGCTRDRPLKIALGIHGPVRVLRLDPIVLAANAAATGWLLWRNSYPDSTLPFGDQIRSNTLWEGQRRPLGIDL